jgi:predicted 3-demethylubiquinone-9 3-methyltransferase (glyoxalase superfamily)
MAKNTICLWYDKDAEAAARFYAETFPDSAVHAVHRAPGDYPSGKAGDVLTVEFTVAGVPCLGLNGGPVFKHNEAFSFQIATDDQQETDRYWNAIVGNGGQESECGWCKDKWGLSWQITPRVLTEALAVGGAEAKRAFDAMMTMRKIDVAAIEAARRGRRFGRRGASRWRSPLPPLNGRPIAAKGWRATRASAGRLKRSRSRTMCACFRSKR